MKKLVEEWLSYAEKDLKTVEKIIGDTELNKVIAFHCHQCIEKSFKAIILFNKKEIPRIHSLIKLYGTVRNYCKIEFDFKIFEMISETYIDSRYPSDVGLLPNGELSDELAKSFYETTKKMFLQIKKYVDLYGKT